MQADNGTRESMGADAVLRVDVDGSNSNLSLRNLTGATVYRFTDSRTIAVRYVLTRRVDPSVARGRFWLTQRTNGAVEDVQAPWMPKRRLAAPTTGGSIAIAGVAADEDPGTECFLVAPSGQCGTIDYTIAPFAPGERPGSTFQSKPGTGESGPIAIIFSRPVQSVTATIYDPTWPGNFMTATDAPGFVEFVPSGQPGVDQPDTGTLTGEISQVFLTPAPLDFVAYTVSIKVTDSAAVLVTCDDGLTRGEKVRCETKVLPAQPFTVVRRTAKGTGFTVQDSPGTSYQQGGIDVWSDTAVAATDVTVRVRLQNGKEITNTTPAHFNIAERLWPVWRFTKLRGDTVIWNVARPTMTPYPGSSGEATFGLFNEVLPRPDSIKVGAPGSGPNKGIFFVTDTAPLTTYAVTLHPGLRPTPPGLKKQDRKPWHDWYDDQNGAGEGTCPCNSVAAFLVAIKRHEGASGSFPSHTRPCQRGVRG